MIFVCPQVALLVAAEFWEQGDLERTVLDQQPIVSVASRNPCPDRRSTPTVVLRTPGLWSPLVLTWLCKVL
jgi:hypothetical protein